MTINIPIKINKIKMELMIIVQIFAAVDLFLFFFAIIQRLFPRRLSGRGCEAELLCYSAATADLLKRCKNIEAQAISHNDILVISRIGPSRWKLPHNN